jgi:7-cyano-7-deazaguanine synthase
MTPTSRAVLCSGGLDSAILLALSLQTHSEVTPLFVRSHLHWELNEISALHRFLAAIAGPNLKPLVVLEMPVNDLYGSHWSLTGAAVPSATSPDDAVYLPGRNVLLISKSLIWCHLNGVAALALGVLKGNPFPDASPGFFRSFADAVNRSVGGSVSIETPFADLTKVEILRRGQKFPLELTWSCIAPKGGVHCGRCNKCAERRRAFAAAGMSDPTDYHNV